MATPSAALNADLRPCIDVGDVLGFESRFAISKHLSSELLGVRQVAHSVLDRPSVRRRRGIPLPGTQCLKELVELLLFGNEV